MNTRNNKKNAHLMNAPGIKPRKSGKYSPRYFKQYGVSEMRVNLDAVSKSIRSRSSSPTEPILVGPVVCDLLKHHKACSFAPECREFGQRTSLTERPNTSREARNNNVTDHSACNNTEPQDREEYEKVLLEQYGFGLNAQGCLNEARSLLSPVVTKCLKHKTSSDIVIMTDKSTSDTLERHQRVSSIGDSAEVEYTSLKDARRTPSPRILNPQPREVHIKDLPHIKLIAEKYTTLKKKNIEVRKLEEKIVCLEYEVFDKDGDMSKPVQTMRAYFSVSTECDKCSDKCAFLNELPFVLKQQLGLDATNVDKIKETEIEIINEKSQENKSYVNDLRQILLRRKALYTKKRASSLDLNYLYNMAKLETSPVDSDFSNTKLLSKKELEEVKELILDKCESRANCISRKTIRDSIRDLTSSQSFSKRPRSHDEAIIYDLLTALQ